MERDTFRNKIIEIVKDFDEKSYNHNDKPWKSSRILRVKPNFFIFSLFIILLFLIFFIFSFFSFFHVFHFFHFFIFSFLSFFFSFPQFSSVFFSFLQFSSVFFLFLLFSFLFLFLFRVARNPIFVASIASRFLLTFHLKKKLFLSRFGWYLFGPFVLFFSCLFL